MVTAHPLATDAGVEVLEAGGNAIDAMVASQLALAVVYPRAGNIGGGGFMVYRPSTGDALTLDYREKAPAAATHDMYLDSAGNVIEGLSVKGHLAAGVPGAISGLVAAHDSLGRLPWKDLVAPAIALSRDGFRITQREADRLNTYAKDIRAFNDDTCPFVIDREWQKGDLLTQEKLAQTLELIADRKADGFYDGPVANAIITEMQSGSGIISIEDLANYRPAWREPLFTQYDEYRIIAMPPSSSGGIALIQMLEMIEPFQMPQLGFQTVETIHAMAEVERRAYADRAMYVGDMDFYEVPLDTILDEKYLDRRMADYDFFYATPSEVVQAGEFEVLVESYETTHFSVVDKEGNAVSVTTTLNSNYGCKVWVDGAGFFLNNEMDDFSVKPGVPNQFGLIGAEANAIAPGKRMLSSMTPTIVEKNGDFFMTIGTPGGATIITSVFQIFLNVVEFGMNASQAVDAPRFHHQWLPDEIVIEPGVANDSIRANLGNMGHRFREVKSIGMVEVILKNEDGMLEGAADPRGDDHAAAPGK